MRLKKFVKLQKQKQLYPFIVKNPKYLKKSVLRVI